MQVDFTPAVFRRLVKGYLWFLPLIIVVMTVEFAVGPWLTFGDEFDKIVATRFKPAQNEWAWVTIGGIALVAHFVGTFGMLGFKKWARPMFVWPMLGFMVIDVLFFGLPEFSSSLMSLITFIDSALFGAITILAFGKDQGAVWFGQTSDTGQ